MLQRSEMAMLRARSARGPIDVRRDVWRRLASDMKPAHLSAIAPYSTLGIASIGTGAYDMAAGRHWAGTPMAVKGV